MIMEQFRTGGLNLNLRVFPSDFPTFWSQENPATSRATDWLDLRCQAGLGKFHLGYSVVHVRHLQARFDDARVVVVWFTPFNIG